MCKRVQHCGFGDAEMRERESHGLIRQEVRMGRRFEVEKGLK